MTTSSGNGQVLKAIEASVSAQEKSSARIERMVEMLATEVRDLAQSIVSVVAKRSDHVLPKANGADWKLTTLFLTLLIGMGTVLGTQIKAVAEANAEFRANAHIAHINMDAALQREMDNKDAALREAIDRLDASLQAEMSRRELTIAERDTSQRREYDRILRWQELHDQNYPPQWLVDDIYALERKVEELQVQLATRQSQ